ncbi:MAG: glycosyltransferase family 2 protein [Armatimonadetes bacterium]|nr:glycosyltransferase [Armatimonadota bacterium]MBS1701622.1 glycosyltransferase family 2 protein [Armatimonadota bacterium]
MNTVDLEVVIPAYNEAERIGRTLERIREYYSEQSYSWRCTVVSDGSKDDTAKIVNEFCAQNPQFQFLDYAQNRGKGYAVRLGMLRAEASRVLFCDADLATPQEETEKLWKALDEGFDVAIGSRPLKDSNLEIRQPLYREVLGRAFNRAVQTLATKGIDDTQCGFKMFTQKAARDIFSRCSLDGFSFDFEALMIARDLDYKIAEVPIRWSHQEGSKVVIWRDGPRMLRDLVKLRMRGKKARMKLKAPAVHS